MACVSGSSTETHAMRLYSLRVCPSRPHARNFRPAPFAGAFDDGDFGNREYVAFYDGALAAGAERGLGVLQFRRVTDIHVAQARGTRDSLRLKQDIQRRRRQGRELGLRMEAREMGR